MKKILQIVLFSIFLYGNVVVASTQTAKITRVGCAITGNTCYAYIDQDIVTTCPKNDKSFRFPSDGANGKEALSILLTAQAMNKSVQFGGASAKCHTGFPSFLWLSVKN